MGKQTREEEEEEEEEIVVEEYEETHEEICEEEVRRRRCGPRTRRKRSKTPERRLSCLFKKLEGPAPKKEVQLWTIGLLDRLTDLVLAFAKSSAEHWFDERGNSPLGRFLRADQPEDSFLPTRRVSFFIFLGLMLSIGALYLSGDQYVQGPQAANLGYENPERVSNASDFPVHIAFYKVGCEIHSREEPVLAGVTGEIRPGRLTAILGRSGSGKTTLANLILGRSRNFCSRQFGTVYMNGWRRSLEVILDRVGFVPQDDVLYPELTVYETLLFSADSRLPRFASREYKKRVVEEALNVLGLKLAENKTVGSKKTGGLSGGEAKRVSIGMELVTHPSVLIMDEPTSGLDSAAAFHLVKTLKMIAQRGVAVVAVLHQPTTRIYNLIDDLILLQNGRPVYVGPRDTVLDYFKSVNFEVPNFVSASQGNAVEQLNDSKDDGLDGMLLTDSSPPEFLIDILAGEHLPVTEHSKSGHNASLLYDLWTKHGNADSLWKEIEVKLNEHKAEEERAMKRLFPGKIQKGESGIETCDDNYPSVFRYWCYIIRGLSGDVSYPIRPKPGLLYQMYLWFITFVRIAWRSGVATELAIVISLACTVGFTRSYNTTWNRRALGAFFISISISLVGMLSALFNDNLAPVQRAAEAGMFVGGYQFAQYIFTLTKGVILCKVFAVSYFTILYLRRGVWCCSPFSWLKYFEFIHILHLLFMCAQSIGAVVRIMASYDMYNAYIMCLAVFICVHTFAFFAPNQAQIKEDSLILDSVRTEPLINFMCSLSYVRYFMEAAMLWEPVDEDMVGRNTTLRFFGYKMEHKPMCYTCMFAIWAFNQALRWVLFNRLNRNAFNALHDTPLFIIFITKVALAFVVSLVTMTVLHELPRLRAIFHSAMRQYREKSLVRMTRSSSSSSLGPDLDFSE